MDGDKCYKNYINLQKIERGGGERRKRVFCVCSHRTQGQALLRTTESYLINICGWLQNLRVRQRVGIVKTVCSSTNFTSWDCESGVQQVSNSGTIRDHPIENSYPGWLLCITHE